MLERSLIGGSPQTAPLDWRTKGLPPRAEGVGAGEIGRLGLSLLDGELLLPAALIRESALRHNIAAMQAFADAHGAHLCPHGKTSMSPELFAMQIEAGAWGLTAATAHHVRIYARLGVPRMFLANQLATKLEIDTVLSATAVSQTPFYCLVDSAEGASRLAARTSGAPVYVLIETGVAGGRSGVRTQEQALALARQVAAMPGLALRGVEAFEGVRQTLDDARAGADAMLGLAVASAGAVAAEGLFAEGPVLLSAGGSAFLDLVAARLPSELAGRPVERVIRPGCYVTHDHGLYAGLARAPQLRPALEVWGAVLSLPEAGRAIVGVGKRDVSSDAGLPLPLWHHRPNEAGSPRPIERLEVAGLWDQHVALTGDTHDLAIGDLVGFGISHPCATFDRWRVLFLVDEERRVTGAVTTLF